MAQRVMNAVVYSDRLDEKKKQKTSPTVFMAPGIDNVRARRREIQDEINRLKDIEASYAALELYDSRSPPLPSWLKAGWYEAVTINGFHFETRITGSNINFLPQRIFLATGLDSKLLKPSEFVIKPMLGGPNVKGSVGTIFVLTTVKNKTIMVEWEVVETGLFAMMGRDSQEDFQLPGPKFDTTETQGPPHPTRGAPTELPPADGHEVDLYPTVRGIPRDLVDSNGELLPEAHEKGFGPPQLILSPRGLSEDMLAQLGFLKPAEEPKKRRNRNRRKK